MNSSLSPNFPLSDVFPPEEDASQTESTSPLTDESPNATSASMNEPTDVVEESGDSVQSFYDPEPLEQSESGSLPPRGQALFQRGVASLRAGEIDTALEIWRQARTEFPSHAPIAHNLD